MIKKLLKLENLSKEESYELFSKFSDYEVEKQSAILALLRAKKETTEEIMGALEHFTQSSQVIEHDFDIIDIVGTGGDGVGTFNISTAASLILASCGVFVAKHGGRSATSRAGSQDVIHALGIQTPQSTQEILELLKEHYYTYLWAPLFNGELKRYGQLRKKLGFPTILNILGPLLNPMRPKKCLIGVYRRDLIPKVAQVLKAKGLQHGLVVHSDDGLDEISISSATSCAEIKNGAIKEYRVNPEDFGVPKAAISDLIGRDTAENATIIQGILTSNIKGPKLDVVLLNAAAGLYLAGKSETIAHGVSLAKNAVKSGKALELLNKLTGKI